MLHISSRNPFLCMNHELSSIWILNLTEGPWNRGTQSDLRVVFLKEGHITFAMKG